MTPESAYTVDRSNYPTLHIRWHRDASVQEFQAYLRDMDALLEERHKITLLFNLPSEVAFTPEQRLLMSRWLRDNEATIGCNVLGACYVTSSVIVGLALRAVFVFSPPKCPWWITTSEIEAEKWCRSKQLARSEGARGQVAV